MELLTIKARDNVSVSWNNNLVLRKVIIEANSVNMKAFSSADTLSMEYSKLLTNYSVNINVPIDEDKKEVKGSEISAEIQSLNLKGGNIMAQQSDKMQRLQDNLNYYNRQYQSIVNNKNSYTSTRTEQYYGPWQPNTWQIGGWEIYSTKGLNWWYGIFWKDGRTGQHMKNDTATREDIRQTLAAKLGCSTECIMLDPHINPRGNTPTHHTGCGDAIMFSSYNGSLT